MNNSFCYRRIERELREINTDEPVAIEIQNSPLNMHEPRYLRGIISGPPDTPYEGRKYCLEIFYPDKYPFKPPDAKFLTKIWHPNVSPVTGTISLDGWSPAMTLEALLLHLQALLRDPDLNNPYDTFVTDQYTHSRDIFILTAKHWSNVYAGGPCKVEEYDEKVKTFTDIGVKEIVARYSLSSCSWDQEATAIILFGDNDPLRPSDILFP